MNTLGNNSASSESERGAFRYAPQAQEPEHVRMFGSGGRLARGSVGVMTFAPTLGLLGKLLSSASAFGIGIMAASSIFVGGSEAGCSGNNAAGWNCTGSSTGRQTISVIGQTARTNVSLKSDWTLRNTASGANDHGLVLSADISGGMRAIQEGSASDTISITAYGHAVNIIGRSGRTSDQTHIPESTGVEIRLIRGIESKSNVAANISSTRGHISATFGKVVGSTGGIKGVQTNARTNNRNMTITATRHVSTSYNFGVYAKKDTSGTLTLSLASVAGSTSSGSITSVGIHVIRTGGDGRAVVTATGSVTGGGLGINANLTANGAHQINVASVTSSGSGVRIRGSRGVTFTATGDVRGSAGYGIDIYRANFTATGALNVTVSGVRGTKHAIRIYDNTASTTTVTTNGVVSASYSGFNGIYINNRGSGNIELNVSGDVQGGGGQSGSFYGYAISVNSATTGSAESGTGTVTVNITSGTIIGRVRGTAKPGAIVNGDGSSTITFSSSNATLSGNVKLGKGADELIISGAVVTAASELDGGQEDANSTDVDTLTFRNGAETASDFLTLDPAKVTNWEQINVSANTSWRILGTKTITADNVSISGTISLSEAAAASRAADDDLTISGNLAGGGSIVLDVNLATGDADTVTVTGNVTGATTLTFNDVTPTGNDTRVTDDITIVTVQGTVSAGAFTSSTVPESTRYSLIFRSSTKTFVFGPARAALCKTPEGGVAGTFVCSGTLNAPETMSASGSTNIVATLNSASTTVASSVSGYIFTLRGANGITFTQSANGGTLVATSAASGIIDAATTGNGNVAITLIGSASLAGSGAAVKVTSTGTGTITVTTNNVTANHSQAKAVKIAGAGTNILFDAKGAIAGGIEVKNTHTTGTATVSAAAAVTDTSGTAIYAYGKGNLVEVKASSTVTGSGGGIKVVNKSAGAGAIKISAAGTITSSGIGIKAENYGTGALTITAAAVSASNNTPIDVLNKNSGNITLNITGAVTGSASTSQSYGIKVVDDSSGNIEINTVSVTGGAHGIWVDKNATGTTEITIAGDVKGIGTSTSRFTTAGGITVRPSVNAGDVTLNLSNHTVEGAYGVYISGPTTSKITVSSSGEIKGKGGIYVYSAYRSPTVDIDVHTVSATGAAGVNVYTYGAGVTASITVASGGKVEGKQYGIIVTSNGTGPIEVDSAGTIEGTDIVGVWITHTGDGDITLTTPTVTGGNQGVLITKTGGGNVTLTSTGSIETTGTTATAQINTVEARVTGGGNISLTVSDVSSGLTGSSTAVFAKNAGAGTITIVGNGDITASGTATKDAGIYAYTDASGGKIDIDIKSSGSVSGKFGIYAQSESTDNITITANGDVTGTSEDGINANLETGLLTINVSADVTGASNKIAIDAQTKSGGRSVITINSGTITASGATGKAITNGAGSSSIVIHSDASVTADIALGAGVDVLTFSGGSNFDRTITIDGGEETGTDTSTDTLHINSISSLLDVTKLTNWEVISLGSGTNARFDGTVTLATDELKLLAGATLSMKDSTAGDTLTIGGDLDGGGTLEIDVNFGTGAKDSLVVSGDITGTSSIAVTNTTPAGATTVQTTIHVVSFTGTTVANAFSLQGSVGARGYTYTLEYDATNKRYTLSGTRANLLCVEDTNTAGTFACAGTINAPEAMVKAGATNIVATLANNATVSVSSFVALYMDGGNGITFTQAANGGTINATGDASGTVWAKTSGNGNIQMTLTGTATLAGSGTAIKATSTGTGSITVSTMAVTANHSQAMAVQISGAGANTLLDAKGVIAGGIEVKSTHTTGTATVSASGTVTAASGTAIYAYGKGNLVEVKASSAVTGSTGGIKVVNKSSGAGAVKISAAGTITSSGVGIHAENDGTGALTITAASVSASNNTPISVINKNSGDITLNITGAVTGSASTTAGEGIKVVDDGSGNIEINTVSVTGGEHGIFVDKNATGTTEITIAGDVKGNGTSTTRLSTDGGITVKPDTNAGDVTLNLSNHTVEGGYGVYVYGATKSKITISSSGEIKGDGGMYIYSSQSPTVDIDVHTVTGTGNTGISVYGAAGGTASITVVSGGKVEGKQYGIVVTSSGSGPIEIDSAGPIEGTDALGVWILHTGDGAVTLTTPTVSAGRQGVLVQKTGGGNVTLTSTGSIESSGTGNFSAVDATVTGSGNISLTVSAVDGTKTGIFAKNVGEGTITIVGNGDIAASGTATKDSGIYAYTNASGGKIDIDIKSAGSVSGKYGIYVESKSTDNITITANGEVTGTSEDGISAKLTTGTLRINVSADVTGSANKTAIKTQTNSGGNTIITINSGTVTSSGGNAITNGSGASTITVHSDASVTASIRLGAGTDVLTFSGSSFDRSITLDGGEESGTDTSTDVLNINNITTLLDATKLTNWEVISFGTGTVGRFDGTVTLATDDLKVPTGATLSLKDEAPGDVLTISGKLSGGGTIEIDINLATGAKDALVVQGDVTGTTEVVVNDKTPGNVSGRQTTIDLVTYTGNSSDTALSLKGTVISQGYSYKIEHDSSTKKFSLVGSRTNLLCVEDTNTAGSFACAGTITIPESMVETGTTNIVATLANDASVSVSAFFALYMLGANAVTFTQAANGGTINGTGNASGAIKAKTTGNGNIQMTLTGTATLAGRGNVVTAESTGTGSITVTTQKVTASNVAGRGIRADGKAAITINANDEITGGIEVNTRGLGGTVTVNASSTVSSKNNNGIHVERHAGGGGNSASIEVNANGAVTGKRDGIYVKDYNGRNRTGTITISASGSVTATDRYGIFVDLNYGSQIPVTITVSGAVSSKSSAIYVKNKGVSNVTISAYNTLTSEETDGIYAYGVGTNITVNTTSAVTGGLQGFSVRNWKPADDATISVTASSTITGNTKHGIYFRSRGNAGVSATVAAVSGKDHGIHMKDIGAVELTVTGAVTGTDLDGINIDGGGSTVTVTLSSTVTGGQTGIYIKNDGSEAGTLLLDVSGAVTGSSVAGINVLNNRVGATTITAASTVSGSSAGIIAKGMGTGVSPVSVSADGAVSATAGTGIDAYGKGDSVKVTTSTTVTGSASRTVSGSVGGIKAVNKSSGAGTVEVNAGGKITSTGGSGIHAENEGTGGLTISAGEIAAHGSGVVAINTNSGKLDLDLSGAITAAEDGGGDGIKATSHGEDDIEVNTVAVTGDTDGIDISKTGGGSISVTISGAVIARGDSNDQAGIAAINDSEGEDITLTLSDNSVTGGYHGLYIYNEGEGNIEVTSTGTIKGEGKHGVYVYQGGGAVDLGLYTISGKEYGLQLKHYGSDTATVTISTDGGAEGGETGIFIYGKSDGDISLTASASIRGRNDDGLYVYQSGDATVTVSVAAVRGGSDGDGIDIRKYGSGNVILTATGPVETANASEQDGIEALSSAAGDISITVGAVTGDADGIDVRNYIGGNLELTVTGAVVGRGVDSEDYGIYAYAGEDAGNITISIGSSGSVSGPYGITASSESSGNITINTSGAITGTEETGILGIITSGELSITVSGNVTGSSSKVAIDTQSDASGTTTIVINSGIITASGGTSIQNDGGISNVTINSGATINEKISLGGGVDKLTFAGKAPASTLELDGGSDSGTDSSVDVLTFSGFTGAVTASQLKNWETIAVVAGTTVTFTGTQSLAVDTLSLSGGIVSLSNDRVDDELTINGDIAGAGSLGIDVNLSTGATDEFIVIGDLTGTHKLIVNDRTQGNQTTRQTEIKVVEVRGTSSSPSLTLQNRFKSGGYAYDLEYRAAAKAFFLTGERSTLYCVESTVTPGNYTCRGTFSDSENMLGEGSGDVVAVLDASAVVNVDASVAMNLEGAGAITFTQAAGGGSINGIGSATGVVHARTSGSGAITITLTGTANLQSVGTAVLVDSTGTGTISVTTSQVAANNNEATAISLMGSGDSIELTTQSGVSGGKAGIIVKNVSSTGTVTVSANADIASGRGTAIYAYGKGARVSVSTAGQASGNAGGIKAVNKSAGAGSVTVTAGNSVTGSSDTGIYATNSGQGGLAITAGVVAGGKAGVDARNYTSGNLTINVTGLVSVSATGNDDGINAYSKGEGDVTVSTVAVTGDASGVDIRNYGGGSITASFNGTILARGSGASDAGVVLINDAEGGDVTATITTVGSVTGQHGIRGVHHGSGAFLLNASGAITGSGADGINVTGGTAGSITLNVGEVSGARRGVNVTNTGAGSVAITATGTVKTNATVTAVTAISVVNSGETTLTLSTVQATGTGVYVNSTGLGSATITLNGAVAATGSAAVHGVYAKAGARAGDTTINAPAGAGVTGRTTAIKAVATGSGSVSIVTSANLAATHGGIHATVAERGNISLNITNDVTVTDSAAIGIDTSTRSGTTTIVIGGGTIGGATSIRNNEGDSTVTVNKGVELDGDVKLGGGADKIIFNESFDATITLDGGQDSGIDRSKDILAIDSGKASIDLDKLKNWEIIQVGSSGTIAFDSDVPAITLNVDQVMLAGTLSLANELATDEFTLRGDLVPHGTESVGVLEIDVNFSTGATDTITISGDITGTHNLTMVDVTLSNQTERYLDRITVVNVTGESSASSLSLTGGRFASGGYLYKLNYNDQLRSYYLTGERGTLKCGSGSAGTYTCSGELTFPENIRTTGNTAARATLAAGATVNVTAGVAIQMTSENAISFTQEASGQPVNASGNATGIVHASNTGRGDVSITLTGTATLDGAGTGVTARSTGTGNVSVTTASVVANHVSATAIRASGRGGEVKVNASAVSAGRNGIIATNRSNGGTSSVVTTGAVTSSGTAIYAFSMSGNVNVNTVGVEGGVSAIVAKNDGGSGNVSVAATGAVTGSGSAIQVYNYGIGTLNVIASNNITGRGSDGIGVIAGASTTSISVSAANSTGQRNAVRIENEGSAAASVVVTGTTIGTRGSAIHVESDGSGDINIVASSRVTGGPQGTGIETRTNGGNTKITLNTGALVSGASGFAIRNDEGTSEVIVNAGASISGRVELGGGVDQLTFADATFGDSILNGGADTGADVSVDVLTINGGSFTLSEDNFVNWESLIFGAQTNIIVNGVSAITANTVTVQGTLSMQDGVTNDTLTVDGNLVGGGTIRIDTDFFSSNTDTLTVVGNVTGRTTIDVRDISPSAGGRDQEAVEIITVTGASTTVSFSLVNGGFTSGAYQYELEFLPSTKTYALSKKQSVGSVMLVAAPIALIDGFAKLPSLHERRSIDSTQSNWSRVIGNTNSYGKAPAGQAEYESQTTGLQAGFDFAKQTTPTGTWVYGVTAQFNSLDTDIKVATTEGELMAEGYGVGATATWVGLNGGYLDVQAQYNQMTIDFKVAGSDSAFIEGQDATAMALSMEIGKRHTIGETLTFLTNGQISWGVADTGDVMSTSGQPIVFGDDANITARFGMRLEYNEEPYNLHFLTNLYYDTLESWEASFANATYRDSKDPVSLEIGLGGSMQLSPNSSLFMQGGFRKTTDDEFEQRDSAHFTTGVRWSW